LHEGLDLAARCGANLLAGRAREELLAAGARPRRPALAGPDALTPAELRVAQHAAQDLSTREIAQHLFVTAKTVETHLTRAYRKLGISSRRELPAALQSGRGSGMRWQPHPSR
jgi:DNA-binding CsgD family transcriptional regulator